MNESGDGWPPDVFPLYIHKTGPTMWSENSQDEAIAAIVFKKERLYSFWLASSVDNVTMIASQVDDFADEPGRRASNFFGVKKLEFEALIDDRHQIDEAPCRQAHDLHFNCKFDAPVGVTLVSKARPLFTHKVLKKEIVAERNKRVGLGCLNTSKK